MACVGGNCKEALYFCFIVCHAYFFSFSCHITFSVVLYLYIFPSTTQRCDKVLSTLAAVPQTREKKRIIDKATSPLKHPQIPHYAQLRPLST